MATTQRPGPTVFVLFGASGDLAKRMVLPAFYRLALEDLLPDDWLLVGNGRGDLSHYDFRQHVADALTQFGHEAPRGDKWERFAERLRFAGGGFRSSDPGSLLGVLAEAKEEVGGDAEIVHYLAVPPVAFGDLTEALGEHGLTKQARVVYEKPFGTSPESFRKLDSIVHRVLDEHQIFRIDHFLGKEATQNLHVLRFANGLFAGAWSRHAVRAVQIDVPEKLGITDRAGFYDATGAVLDMLVTHLFQVAAEVAMEPPKSLSADDLQSAREEVIGCFRPLDPAEVVLGQFEGYRDVPGVADGSTTDTYVAARLWIDNDRWKGVPFLLRTGKRMATTRQRVSLVLREPDGTLPDVPLNGNVLGFDLGGSGAIELSMVAKRPGPALALDVGDVRLDLGDLAEGDPLPPYVRLIHDVLTGDRSLFTRPDGLEQVWRTAQPLLDHRPAPKPYAPGSWGPVGADELAAPGGWLLGG